MNNELIKLIKSVQPTGRMGNNNEPVWNAEKVYGLMVKAQQQVNSVDLADVGGNEVACDHPTDRIRLIGRNITCLNCKKTWKEIA